MSGVVTPMLLLTGVSYANNVYNTGNVLDVKPLIEGAVATGILAGLATIPDLKPVAVGLAWIAFVALLISPIQKPSPVDNLMSIIGGKPGKVR